MWGGGVADGVAGGNRREREDLEMGAQGGRVKGE